MTMATLARLAAVPSPRSLPPALLPAQLEPPGPQKTSIMALNPSGDNPDVIDLTKWLEKGEPAAALAARPLANHRLA